MTDANINGPSDASAPAPNASGVARSLWRRYVVAVSIVALSLIVSHQASVGALSNSNEASTAINVAGRQRMLSQRILFLASQDLTERGPGSRAEPLPELTRAAELFEKSHIALMSGGAMGLTVSGAAERAEIYSEIRDGRSLASLVPAFVYLANVVRTGAHHERVAAFEQMREFGQDNLLQRLDIAVKKMELGAQEVVVQTKQILLISLLAALGILLVEIMLIFRPAQRLVANVLSDLENARNAAETANAKAETALAAQSKFFGYMSHEMRTPLNGIIGMLNLLKEGYDAKDQDRYLFHASAAAEHLLNMLSNVLDLSRLEVGMMSISNAPYRPQEVLETGVQLFEGQARNKRLDLSLQVHEEVPAQILGDRSRVLQIVTNIIGNAVKFTDRGSVTVCLRLADGKLCIEVSDTGPGLDPKALPSLFDDFTTAELTSDKSAMGSGLGLSISQQLTHRMGGTITAENRADGGSLFRMTIPFELADDANGPSGVKAVGGVGSILFAGRNFLIVDDNETNRLIAQAYLKALGGAVSLAADGDEAVALFARTEREGGRFDVILMDQRMPVMDGLQATRRMRAIMEEQSRRTPILIVSANISDEDRANASDAGADGFLPKPLRRHDLIEAVAAQLDDAGASDGAMAGRDGFAA